MKILELLICFLYVVVSALSATTPIMFISGVLLATVLLVEAAHHVERRIEEMFLNIKNIKENQDGRND